MRVQFPDLLVDIDSKFLENLREYGLGFLNPLSPPNGGHYAYSPRSLLWQSDLIVQPTTNQQTNQPSMCFYPSAATYKHIFVSDTDRQTFDKNSEFMLRTSQNV